MHDHRQLVRKGRVGSGSWGMVPDQDVAVAVFVLQALAVERGAPRPCRPAGSRAPACRPPPRPGSPMRWNRTSSSNGNGTMMRLLSPVRGGGRHPRTIPPASLMPSCRICPTLVSGSTLTWSRSTGCNFGPSGRDADLAEQALPCRRCAPRPPGWAPRAGPGVLSRIGTVKRTRPACRDLAPFGGGLQDSRLERVERGAPCSCSSALARRCGKVTARPGGGRSRYSISGVSSGGLVERDLFSCRREWGC